MKLNVKILVLLVFFAALIILINQVFWVVNMYRSYQQELIYAIDHSLNKSINMEVTERKNNMGLPIIMRFAPDKSNPKDEEEIILRKIQTEDTTFLIRVNKTEPNLENQILQYFLLKESPINLDHLNGYFQAILKEQGFSIRTSYMEYYDLKTKVLLKHNKPKRFLPLSILSTDTVPLDILKGVGVKAYVTSSPRPILAKMIYQILLSVLLMLFALWCLLYLFRTIIRQRRFEEMQQNFVNAMVHEFKRPIASASMMLELMPSYLKQNETGKVEQYMVDSLLELKKLTAYTDRIQRISNNETDRISLEKTAMPLVPFFKALTCKFLVNEKKTVEIKLSVQTVLECIDVDVLHFSNLMENLMENAVKYSDNPVHIGLTVKEFSGVLEIAVADDGFGISELDKKYIFDKFYRVPAKEGRKLSGFGLGLTYVKAIVEAHGGQIRVMNAPVRGSVFVIRLPI
jgi:two-component system, OmpR family, phosphate regulon sensor histidine kinase PhoR